MIPHGEKGEDFSNELNRSFTDETALLQTIRAVARDPVPVAGGVSFYPQIQIREARKARHFALLAEALTRD